MAVAAKFFRRLIEEYGDDLVRTVREALGDAVQPEQVEQAVKRAAAQKPKVAPHRGRTPPNLREQSTHEAIRTARREPHLKQSADGQYVGAPRGVKSKRDVNRNRRAFDTDVAAGIEGADWYSRAREANREWAGPNLDRQRLLAQEEEALWSAQADPDTNLNFALQGHNAYELGVPMDKVRTTAQASKYRMARDTGLEIPLGKKTGPYGQHLDPTQPHATTGTNDIWHARGFGYGDLPDSGLGDAQHRFLDYETMLAVDRARKARLGGRDDWLAHEIQASPWVAGKGRSLSERYNIPLDEGLERATKSYPDFADKFTAFATGEQVPFVQSGHLPGINAASDAERLAYSRDPGRRWDDANQRDVIYDALGLYQRPTLQATGVYTPPGGVLENNPVSVARPLVGLRAPAEVDDASRSAMDLAETLRAYTDAQGSGAWHSVFTGKNVPNRGSLFLPREGASDPETVQRLRDLSAAYDLGDVVDTGRGLTISNFYPGPPTGAATSRALRSGGLREKIANVTDAPIERAAVDSNYIGMLEDAPEPGAGAATGKLLDTLAQHPESVTDKLDAYGPLRARYASGADVDDAVAAQYGGTRSDVQTARRILAEKGLRGLKEAYEAGVPLPVFVGLATSLGLVAQPGEEPRN